VITTDENPKGDQATGRRGVRRRSQLDVTALQPLHRESEILASQFQLVPRNGPVPAGFYQIHIGVEKSAELSSELPQRLFFDYGVGLTNSDSILLPPLSSGGCTEVFKLDRPAHCFRLQFTGGLVNVADTKITMNRLVGLSSEFIQLRRLLWLYRSNPQAALSKVLKRLLRPFPRILPDWAVGKTSRILTKAFRAFNSRQYRRWIEQFDVLNDRGRTACRTHIERFERAPLISILMPTFNPPLKHLRSAIESVQSQLYENWELCIADDNSSDKRVLELLKEFELRDERIKIVFRSENGHISRATNSALELASGNYVALLDHDDVLSEDALYHVANELNQFPDARLLYSDEDKISETGKRFEPYFKPSYSPDLLLSQNYISHLGVYETKLLREIEGMRPDFEGAQDYDLLLRFIERISPDQIRHIPRVLYHWRTTRGSTSTGAAAKPYATLAARRAIQEHLDRTGERATAEAAPGYPHYPKITILIPIRDRVALLDNCLRSIRDKSSYPNYELLIVDNDSHEEHTLTYLDKLEQSREALVLRYPGRFNYSGINNFGAGHASGEILVLLNNDVEVISPDWLEELAGQALRPEVGAVGARLLFPDGTIQHAGVTLGIGGVASHTLHGTSGHGAKHFGHANLIRNVSAVTGACLATRKSTFLEMGGLDQVDLTVGYNDTDYCMRVMQSGLRVLYTPYAELVHHESKSRGSDFAGPKLCRFLEEQAIVRARWPELLNNDPFYNPNLSLTSTDFDIAWPPRRSNPWQESRATSAT
jgi:GT2 family glycosyltransferase